ncbi:GLPGLI family protein [Pedobacter sp. LMG 31464]|uniref:GLPGLI family protein n=1 Tax=Pedobacter planticolens TaxID=2679964 RepID=A0A923DWE7_9SPHI|nr:GLPGLI family protein [Pedobacter planticolens]MBB2145187.1 GLPGLI family protein [Pedobacter planticolens]
MKILLTTFFAIATTSIALAQNPDKALSRVKYTFTHIQDTMQRDKPFTENMLLVIGKNASVFTSYDKINRELETQKQIQEQVKNQAGSGQMSIKITGQGPRASSLPDYFFFAKENKFFTQERIFNNYLIEEVAPQINWKLTKDTNSFSGVKCQMATTYFKGRNWIAWYAPELPFQSGPWKLNGLPGLIIEAYDETKTVQFQFAGMDNVVPEETKATEKSDGIKIVGPNGSVNAVNVMGIGGGTAYLGNEVKLPADAIRTTRKELDKLKEARDKDPQGFMNAQMAAQGVQMGVSRSVRVASGGPTANKIVINNPIELPEKEK